MAAEMVQPTLSTAEMAIRLGIAAGLGAAIGIEREWKDRAAGLRTHLLVALGSAAMTIMSAYGWADFYHSLAQQDLPAPPMRDPARVAAQIVSGIGFLAGGVILRSGFTVMGLTTAASLWAACGVGMAAGAGMPDLAVMLTGGLLFTLVAMKWVNDQIARRSPSAAPTMLTVRITNRDSSSRIVSAVGEHLSAVESFTTESAGIDTEDRLLTWRGELQSGVDRVDVAESLAGLPGVSEVHVSARDD